MKFTFTFVALILLFTTMNAQDYKNQKDFADQIRLQIDRLH